MKLTERNIRNGKLLTLLLTFAVLLSAFCFGCSGSKKPAANDPVTEKPKAQMPEVPMDKTAERYGTVYLDSERTQEFNLYQEPASAKSPVTGKVKAGDQFRILDEKDFFVLVETEDKRKGWIFKHNVAEYFFWKAGFLSTTWRSISSGLRKRKRMGNSCPFRMRWPCLAPALRKIRWSLLSGMKSVLTQTWICMSSPM